MFIFWGSSALLVGLTRTGRYPDDENIHQLLLLIVFLLSYILSIAC